MEGVGGGAGSERSCKMGKWRRGADFGPVSGDEPDCAQSVLAAGPLRWEWRVQLLGVLPEDQGRMSFRKKETLHPVMGGEVSSTSTR